MITVDDRTGSADLYPHLQRRGLPVRLGRMAYGDVSWIGDGIDGSPVSVGVEYKKIRDVLQCVTDGRFAGHQLPGLINSYNQIYLMVEGQWRPRTKDGLLEIQSSHGFWYEATVGQRRFMYRDLVTWLCTIQIKGGIQIVRVSDLTEASMWLSAMWNWWKNGWESHESHLAMHVGNAAEFRDRAVLVRPTILRMVAAQLPGIGFDKSAAIAGFFGSISNLSNASVSDLQCVPGVGKELANRIYRAIRQEEWR